MKRKTNFQENDNSCSKPWVNPFKKLEIFSIILKWHFCSLKCLFFPLAHNQTIYRYTGLQGVTRGYRGLRGVTRAYRGLQGVTGGYRGLQGVTRGYRGLQGVTGEMDLPKKRKKKSKFWLLRMLEKDDHLFHYLRFVGKYAFCVLKLFLAIRIEIGRKSTQ